MWNYIMDSNILNSKLTFPCFSVLFLAILISGQVRQAK